VLSFGVKVFSREGGIKAKKRLGSGCIGRGTGRGMQNIIFAIPGLLIEICRWFEKEKGGAWGGCGAEGTQNDSTRKGARQKGEKKRTKELTRY